MNLPRPSWIPLVLLLAACASQVPEAIRTAPPGAPSLARVRTDPAAWSGHAVRWGGEIVRVENLSDHTLVYIVERPLDHDGRPRRSDHSDGRFIARIRGFLDPAVYARRREITVAGKLDGIRRGRIGDYDYVYPVVDAGVVHLWPRRTRRKPPPPPPWYYDPWCPWYPWSCGPYPYWWR